MLAGLAVSVATIGFYGAQRLWYAAVWRGRPFSLEDAVDASRRMFGRFFRTGVLVLVPPSIVAMGATAAYYLRLVSAASSAPMRRRSSA